MGIRVDEERLNYQLEVSNCSDRKKLDYHKALLNGELPYTPTDCSGFVQGVFAHFGISLPRTTSTQWAAKTK